MKYNLLEKANIKISQIGLGTMTWGEQNTPSEAFEQMDFSLERGVSFWDTAELYPVPPKEETYTRTESIIGDWFEKTNQRDKVVLATKVAGPFLGGWIRGQNNLNRKNLFQALENSLKRLKTDYIDLYQIHWPSRPVNNFGKMNFVVPIKEVDSIPFLETLTVLNEFQKLGKIRCYGLSNETPWGVMQYINIARENGFSLPVSIQNPYNLLNRVYEIALAEFSYNENIGLLAYSPLAFGVLSGKYLKGQKPRGSRLEIFKNHFLRYNSNQSMSATNEYIKISQKYNLVPSQMALAFINQQPFCISNLVGATNLVQLQENIESINIDLSPAILEEIDSVHQKISNPAP